MVKKIYLLTVFKTVKSKFVRFLVNMLIVLLSISLAAALGYLPYGLKDSYLVNYEMKTPDIMVKLKDGKNVVDAEAIDRIKELNNVDMVEAFFAYDSEANNKFYRLYVVDFTSELAGPKLYDGRLPNEFGEVLIHKNVDNKAKYNIGDKITINLMGQKQELTVVGIANTPMYNSTRSEVVWNDNADTDNPDYLDSIFYMDYNTLNQLFKMAMPKTDLYITLKNKSKYMSDDYDKEVKKLIEEIRVATNDEYTYLTLNDNTSYKMFSEFNNTIHTISIVFPILFIVVCALVIYLIVEKLILDERQIIACEYSQGMPKSLIANKYMFFGLLSTTLGVLGGYFVGVYLLPRLFYTAYDLVYDMHGVPENVLSPIGVIMGGLMILVSIIVTLSCVYTSLRETPASLMLQKAPKPGKKILLEKVGFIWNRLSFSFKSSIRNIFRNKKNLVLTSLSVIGSSILILIGFALNDSAVSMYKSDTYKNVAPSMGLISLVVIIIGLSIGILVIYALASMNIDDREREIAVLKVLGYHDVESALYASRELVFITLAAGLIGIPVGTLVVYVVFTTIDFAKLSDVQWYSYVSTYAITSLSSLISSFLLYPKIKRIDFNISLKSVE